MSATTRNPARRRLIRIGLGWVTVALLEAAAYTALALAIAHHRPPGIVLAVTFASLLVTVLVSRAGYVSGVRLAGDLYAGIGSSLARAKVSWFTADNRALLASVATRGIPGMMGVPAHQLQSYVVTPLLPILLLAGIWILGGALIALIVGALLLVSLIAQTLAQRSLARADARRHAAEHAATVSTLELVEHLELLRSAAGPVGSLARLDHSWRGHEAALEKTNLASAPATFISTVATVLPLAGLLLVLSRDSGLTPATMLGLIVLTARAAAPLETLALAGLGINQLRDTVADYRTASAAPALTEPKSALSPEGHVLDIETVTHAPALHAVNVTVAEGERVLISGRTGSGKSTLLGLVMRFDDPDSGGIRVGGHGLPEIGSVELARNIGYVPQDPVVFSGSLAENIGLGRPGATTAEITDIARRAALGSVLDRHPQGIHQDLGHNGSALSGGERQRVAIARALLKDAPILVLDEATSALDEGTEREIARTVRTLSATVLIVTHRDPEIWAPTRRIDL